MFFNYGSYESRTWLWQNRAKPRFENHFTGILVLNRSFHADIKLNLRKLISENVLKHVPRKRCVVVRILSMLGSNGQCIRKLCKSIKQQESSFQHLLACTHRVLLIHLDVFGLGAGLELKGISRVNNAAKSFIKHQTSYNQRSFLDGSIESATAESVNYIRTSDSLGIPIFSFTGKPRDT